MGRFSPHENEMSRSPGNTLLLRKSTQNHTATAANGHGNVDAAAEGSQVAADWHGSIESLILACVRIKNALLTFGEDQALLDAFLTALVDGHVLSRADAKLGRAAPKLSKLAKIGEHADLLGRTEISSFLVPSYTTIYQLVILSELPQGDEEQRVKELARILANCRGEISRDYLIEETRRLKKGPKPKQSGAKGVTAARISGEPPAAQTLPHLIEARQQFDLLLLTPSERDLAHLRADYPDGSTLERCLPLWQLIEQSAAAVITARIFDLPVIANVLLPRSGFSRLSRVLLARRPTSPDVADAEVFVTAERGEMRLSVPEDGTWLDDADPIDPLTVAARLCPAASRRLHVFAPAQADGWHCLVGDDSWTEVPSIR